MIFLLAQSNVQSDSRIEILLQSPVRDRQSKQRNYLGKTACIPATEYSGSPAPPPKGNSTKGEQIVLESDDDLMSHETRLSRMSQESFEFEISVSDWPILSTNY